MDCISQWHYRPAIKDDQRADAPMTVTVDWKLGDNDANKMGNAGKNKSANASGQ